MVGVGSATPHGNAAPGRSGAAAATRRRLIIANDADGIIGGIGLAQEQARGVVIVASRGDGIIGAAPGSSRERGKRLGRGRFTGASRGDGIIGAAPGSSRERGFTLLEIIVVLAIIAAATVLGAMVVTGGFERMQLQSDSKQILANLRYTRAQAMATGTPQRFVIDPQAHTWQAPNGRHGSVHPSLAIHFIGAREVTPARGVGAIVFFPDGASTGGRVQLIGGRAAWNVDVKWLTGEVSLRRGKVQR